MAARILVIGVGGGGSRAVAALLAAGVHRSICAVVDSDQQALHRSEAPIRIAIGDKLTRGLGAGGNPSIGERSAEESAEELFHLCSQADMVFIAAGMGGGTGTGASPVVAEIAQSCGALTVGVVTKPFSFEGARRRQAAEQGLGRLKDKVNTLIAISTDRLLPAVEQPASLATAFATMDDALRQSIEGIIELITAPGLINLDLADLKAILGEAGLVQLALGRGRGWNRAADAARAAISSPLLDESLTGAHGALLNITGGPDLTLNEINEAAEQIRQTADPEANIIFGAVVDPRMQDEVKLTVIATGFDGRQGPRQPNTIREHLKSWRIQEVEREREVEQQYPAQSPLVDDDLEGPAAASVPARLPPRPPSLEDAAAVPLPLPPLPSIELDGRLGEGSFADAS